MSDREVETKSPWLSDFYREQMKEQVAVTNINNEIYSGETIRSPKNSVMLFNNCEFDNCTFIMKS